MLSPSVPAIVVEGHQDGGVGVFDVTTDVTVIYFDIQTQKFEVGYHDSKQFFQGASTQIGKVFKDNRNGILINLDSGRASSWSTNITLIGIDKDNHTINKYIDLPDKYEAKGEIKDKSRVIVHLYEGDMEYTWNGEQFEGKRIFVQPTVNTGDISVHYSQNSDGTLTVDNQKITLKIGQKLVLIREDQLPVGKRILEYDNAIEFVKGQQDIFVGRKEGTSGIAIIPNGGYDWANARTITVTVVPIN